MILAIGSDVAYLNTLSEIVNSAAEIEGRPLGRDDRFVIVEDVLEALVLAQKHRPLVVILDLSDETRWGLSIIKELLKHTTDVIVVSKELNKIDCERARNGGASLYINRRKFNRIAMDIIDHLSCGSTRDSVDG